MKNESVWLHKGRGCGRLASKTEMQLTQQGAGFLVAFGSGHLDLSTPDGQRPLFVAKVTSSSS